MAYECFDNDSFLVVGLDFVVPAVTVSQLRHIQIGNKKNKSQIDKLINVMSISANQLYNYAINMRRLPLGRVLCDFTTQDADEYLKNHPKWFKEFDHPGLRGIYEYVLPDDEDSKEDAIVRIIHEMINDMKYYPTNALNTCGLATYDKDGKIIFV